MKFQYRKYPSKKHETIEVTPNGPGTVKFMTAREFKNYAGGRTHTYFKGRIEGDNVSFLLPFDNIWHAVVEQDAQVGKASVQLLAADPSSIQIGPGPEEEVNVVENETQEVPLDEEDQE